MEHTTPRSRFLPRVGRFALSGTAPKAVLVAVAYYVGAKIGFAFTLQPHPISVLWPPNAILLAAMLLTPVRAWWVLIATTFPAHVAAEMQSGVPLAMVLAWFTSNCSEALLGAGLIRYLLRATPRFHSLRDVGVVLACGVLLGPLASSFLDAGLVKLIGWGEDGYLQLVRTRCSSNVLAALTLVPVILTWAADGARIVRKAWSIRQWETALVLAGLSVVCVLLFDRDPLRGGLMPALFYAPLPFLLWAAVRLGTVGTSTALLVMVVLVIWSVVKGHGPFVSASPEENARATQMFLTVVSLPVLLLSVVLEERRRIQQQVREKELQLAHLGRVATLGTLSGALAHELNQPLTAILSNAQAAQHFLSESNVDAAEVAAILFDIVADDRRAGEIVERLRALFRRGDVKLEPVDLNQVVRDVLVIADGQLKAREIEVVVHAVPHLPALRGDRIQLQQVVLNLVINASEAMEERPPGARRLTITAEEAPAGVQLAVADEGQGIAPSDLELIFEPFFTTKASGLGLGLSISRSIIEAHGGRLWCRDNSERGATFCISLPAQT